jgi:transposase-like protein
VGGTPNPPSQEEVARRLNVPLSTLRTWLQRLRHRYRESLRAEVARTVPNSADVDEELHYLYRVLMS